MRQAFLMMIVYIINSLAPLLISRCVMRITKYTNILGGAIMEKESQNVTITFTVKCNPRDKKSRKSARKKLISSFVEAMAKTTPNAVDDVIVSFFTSQSRGGIQE